ncbi:MAG TPA: hypothetical protein VGX70_16450 [Gemmataceae bacterium]|nr:hypothetical protein [Gemmataceae bacterium]
MAKKQSPKKPSLEEILALLRHRYGGRLAPPMEGFAYRFTIWLPILTQGKAVFTEEQQSHLNDLFHDCFGGFSQSSVEGFPPWSGSWLPAEAEEPIVDHHIVLIIYALQDVQSLACMRHLKWILQQEHVAAQEVVLIEQIPVHLIEAVKLI